ncbi:MAG TPA: hypothetical protein PLB58_07760 [Bacilli bacterium]|nr:hypothetical protein [Bacilli bacterium]
MKINVQMENDGTREVSVNIKFDENFDSIDATIALVAINEAVLDCFPSKEMQLLAKNFLLKFLDEEVANYSAKIVN